MPCIDNMLTPVNSSGWSNRAQFQTIGNSENVTNQPAIERAIELSPTGAGIRHRVWRDHQAGDVALPISAVQRASKLKREITVEERFGHTGKLSRQMSAFNLSGAGRKRIVHEVEKPLRVR